MYLRPERQKVKGPFRLNRYDPQLANCKALWLFNEGAGDTIYNHIRDAHHGIIQVSSDWTQSDDGLNIPDQGGLVYCPYDDELADLTHITLFCEVENLSNGNPKFLGSINGDNSTPNHIKFDASGGQADNQETDFILSIGGSSSGSTIVPPNNTFTLGDIYIVCYVYDGAGERMYIKSGNGQIYSTTSSKTGTLSHGTTASLLFGRSKTSDSNADVILYQTRLYDEGLEEAAVRSILDNYYRPFDRPIPYVITAVTEGEVTGNGDLNAGDSTISGSGDVQSTITGNGDLSAQSATIAGEGTVQGQRSGNADLQAGNATVAGEGTVQGQRSGNADLQAGAATVTGEGNVTTPGMVEGSVDLQAGAATIAGEGTIQGQRSGSADLQAGSATITAIGTVETPGLVNGNADLNAQSATIAAVGDIRSIISGNADLTAVSATISGTLSASAPDGWARVSANADAWTKIVANGDGWVEV